MFKRSAALLLGALFLGVLLRFALPPLFKSGEKGPWKKLCVLKNKKNHPIRLQVQMGSSPDSSFELPPKEIVRIKQISDNPKDRNLSVKIIGLTRLGEASPSGGYAPFLYFSFEDKGSTGFVDAQAFSSGTAFKEIAVPRQVNHIIVKELPPP